MEYIGRIIRPPSEADSILLQVSVGCSHNRCTFCGAYRKKRFAIKSMERIEADIRHAGLHCRDQRRLFLVDGDPLIIPQARLLAILDKVREHLPWVTRVGCYANAKAISLKSDGELAELRRRGLGMLFLGLESGDDEVLRRVGKWGDSERITMHARRAIHAGFKLNVTVLLGLGGVDGSQRHARETGRVLTAIDPEQAAAPARPVGAGPIPPPGRPGHARRTAAHAPGDDPDQGSFPVQSRLELPAVEDPSPEGKAVGDRAHR
jgi:radical SAM superfamily enzyme YgiQ (UPF0313 family)